MVSLLTARFDPEHSFDDALVQQVHWVYPYKQLRAANVLATLAVIELAADTKPKALSFVSTTAAIEKS
ncbi:hypothetical protein B8W95_13905, partial [Staphylococcus pasteuri]